MITTELFNLIRTHSQVLVTHHAIQKWYTAGSSVAKMDVDGCPNVNGIIQNTSQSGVEGRSDSVELFGTTYNMII